jgi:uncharacterized RDD family membrane protein YckC
MNFLSSDRMGGSMAFPMDAAMLIESYYTPDKLVTASPARRLGGYALDVAFAILTLGIGWFVWFCIVAPRGQTPGKQLVGLYIMKADGTRAGGGYTWLREFVIKGLLFGVLASITLSFVWWLAALWCLWDRERQCLWDKVANTYVAWSPMGYRPPTANELVIAGQPMPERAVPVLPAPPAAIPAPEASVPPPQEVNITRRDPNQWPPLMRPFD